MIDSNIKFGLLGCGRIAKRYSRLLSGQVEGARLVSVCDVDERRALELAGYFGITSHTNALEMLKQQKPDVICVLTPSGCHARHVIEIAPHCKNIVVEKPMALTVSDASKMMEACRQHAVKLHVVKQNRFNVPVIELKKALDAGRFGKIIMGTVRLRWCRRQDYYDSAAWRGTWAFDGGVLANQASHHIDLLQWMLGEVKSVVVKGKHFLAKIEAEDTAVALLEFESGSYGVIEATTATRPRDTEGSFSILGETGMVELEGFAANRIKTWQFENPQPVDAEILLERRENPVDPHGYGHRKFLEQIVHAVRGGRDGSVSGNDGFKNVRLLEALYESMMTGCETCLSQLKFSHSLLGKDGGGA